MAGVSARVQWGKLLACFLIGAGVAWARPAGKPGPEAWAVFSVFAGVVSGFLLRPLDMAPTVLIGVLALAITGTVRLDTLIASGFGDETVWLVVAAFLLADAVEKTGLGRRIALLLLRALGRSLSGLAYAIAAAELILAPFIPSNTARGGGILSPIVIGLAQSLGSRAETPRLGGAYLIQVGAHSNLVTSSMFLTAMAGNALIPRQAWEHLGIEFGYWQWLQGSIVPGLISLALVPLIVRLVERPDPVDVSAVRSRVADELAAMGPWKREERLLALVLLVLLFFWASGKALAARLPVELGPTAVALLGVALLVVLGIRSWRDLAGSWRAWDALIWLGGFVALAAALNSTGFTAWFGEEMRARVTGLGGVETAIAIALVYFASMYLFSQLTAHAAIAGVFLAVAGSAGAHRLLAVALIAYFTCLCGATTPWSTGPVIIYFSHGYVSVRRWMRNGLVLALAHLAVWLTAGLAWWRMLGWLESD